MSDNEEKGVGVKYITGFASLADAIASDVDHSTVIYKRFDRLAARNLLYMQSELGELEQQQEAFDREDVKCVQDRPELRKALMSWKAFSDGVGSGDEYLRKRMDLVVKIRGKLKEYREALLFESAILSLRTPSRQTHRAFSQNFWNRDDSRQRRGHDSSPSSSYPTLRDASENLYDDKQDLVALHRSHEDRLTIFLRNHFAFLFRNPKRNQNQTDTDSDSTTWAYFSATRISIVVTTITVLTAAAFLFGAIYNLYYVESDAVKLGLITAYTVAFALAVALVTDVDRSGIFGACAAYAAVLVVFVSGDLGGSSGGSSTDGNGLVASPVTITA